jgi:hypothetical protein
MVEKTDWTQDSEGEEHDSLAPASIVPEGLGELRTYAFHNGLASDFQRLIDFSAGSPQRLNA